MDRLFFQPEIRLPDNPCHPIFQVNTSLFSKRLPLNFPATIASEEDLHRFAPIPSALTTFTRIQRMKHQVFEVSRIVCGNDKVKRKPIHLLQRRSYKIGILRIRLPAAGFSPGGFSRVRGSGYT